MDKPYCGCGCKLLTRGGTFRAGHDSKHRSRLIQIARGDDHQAKAEAMEELERRGWLKFLDPSHSGPKNPKGDRRAEAADKADIYTRMKQAGERLKQIGRYSGADRLVVTKHNLEDILNATDDELRAWPTSKGAWHPGDPVALIYQGLKRRGQITEVAGERCRVQVVDVGVLVVDLASLIGSHA